MNYEKIYKKAIDTYGIDMQLNVAIEEMSELIKEICKAKRYGNNRDHIAEEVADVYVMLKQTRIIYNISDDELYNLIDFKTQRLEKRLKDLEDGNKECSV